MSVRGQHRAVVLCCVPVRLPLDGGSGHEAVEGIARMECTGDLLVPYGGRGGGGGLAGEG